MSVPAQITTLPNGLTVNTDVGNVAAPTCSKTMSGLSPRISRTRLSNARDTPKRSFSSSGVSPPLRIMPANSLRLLKPFAPSCLTSSPFSSEDTTPTESAPVSLASCVANTPRPPAAPQISTLCPACISTWSISIR